MYDYSDDELDFDLPLYDEWGSHPIAFTHICNELKQYLPSQKAHKIADAIVAASRSKAMAGDVFRILSKNIGHKIVNGQHLFYVKGVESFDLSQYLKIDVLPHENRPINYRFIEHFKSFTNQYKAQGKKENQGEIGQLATIATYQDFASGMNLDYTFMDEGLKYIGIDPKLPFTVLGEPSRQEVRAKAQPTFADRDTSAATSKADMVFVQGDKRIGVSIKFFGGQDPGIGIWEPTDLHKYIVEHYNNGENTADLNMLKHSLERWHQERTVAAKAPHAIFIGKFLTTKLGKQFLFDILTDTTATCKLHKDHAAQYILNVDKMGRMYFYSVMDYIDMLQDSYVGTCGCGFVLESTASKRGGQLQYRNKRHYTMSDLVGAIF